MDGAARERELYEAARRLPASERPAYLERHCGDGATRRQIERMLELAEEEGALQTAGAGGALLAAAADPIGASIGGYRIERLIAAGGMGVVYEAEQASTGQRVALKLIRPGVSSPGQLARFRHEAEVLGRLRHPGIARIHDAGAVDAGYGEQPFFAMELLEGLPLTEYADAHGLDGRRRAALLAAVADAVHHAHQRGVVHRDLKPANILVVTEEGEGRPRVLDFGVARVTAAAEPVTTMHTREGQLIGTLPYMSPEQLGADPDAVDLRSDVYALGVLGYELFAGRLPHDLEGRPITEAARRIVEDEPPPLGRWDRRLSGDLETIVGVALEKDPDRRYASAAELAADLRRYLDHRPIAARPAGSWYLLVKFARRRRALVGGLALALLGLLAGSAVAIHQAVVASAERDRAVAAVQRADAVRDFMVDTFGLANPGRAERPDLPVREALEIAGRTLDRHFEGFPAARAEARGMVGELYHELGLYASARVALERARGELAALGEAGSEAWIDASLALASTRAELGELDAARGLAAEVLERLGPPPGDGARRAHARLTLGRIEVLAGRHDAALAQLGAAAEPSAPAPVQLSARIELASLHVDRGDLPEAERLYREALDEARAGGHGAELEAICANGLQVVLAQAGAFEEAASLAERVLALRREVYGDRHPMTVESLLNHGALDSRMGRHGDAERRLREALETARAIGGGDPLVAGCVNELASELQDQGRVDEALPLFREALELWRGMHTEPHLDLARGLNNLALACELAGLAGEAGELYAESVEVLEALGDEGHPYVGVSLVNQAGTLLSRGELEPAAEVMRRALAAHRRAFGERHPETARALHNLGYLLGLLGERAESERLLREALGLREELLPGDHPETALTRLELGRLLLEGGDAAAAAAQLERSAEGFRASLGEDHPETLGALELLEHCRAAGSVE